MRLTVSHCAGDTRRYGADRIRRLGPVSCRVVRIHPAPPARKGHSYSTILPRKEGGCTECCVDPKTSKTMCSRSGTPAGLPRAGRRFPRQCALLRAKSRPSVGCALHASADTVARNDRVNRDIPSLWGQGRDGNTGRQAAGSVPHSLRKAVRIGLAPLHTERLVRVGHNHPPTEGGSIPPRSPNIPRRRAIHQCRCGHLISPNQILSDFRGWDGTSGN